MWGRGAKTGCNIAQTPFYQATRNSCTLLAVAVAVGMNLVFNLFLLVLVAYFPASVSKPFFLHNVLINEQYRFATPSQNMTTMAESTTSHRPQRSPLLTV